MLIWFILIVVAYLMGSIPAGVVVAKLWGGVDIRTVGSKNIGATNVARQVGKLQGVVTLLCDIFKGAIPVWIAQGLAVPGAGDVVWVALVGLAAFLGHLFSVFLHFKGGKGVATALGVFIALAPWAVLPSAAIFLLIVILTKYISLGSMISSLTFPIFAALFGYNGFLVAAGAVMALLIVIRHHENIKRLLSKDESKF